MEPQVLSNRDERGSFLYEVLKKLSHGSTWSKNKIASTRAHKVNTSNPYWVSPPMYSFFLSFQMNKDYSVQLCCNRIIRSVSIDADFLVGSCECYLPDSGVVGRHPYLTYYKERRQ